MQPAYKIKQIEDVIQSFDSKRQTLIDVRTPAEFAEDHIPGAVNLPVLSNEERVTVGTLYKANSFEARHHGAALVSKNIAGILPRIEDLVREDMQREGQTAYQRPQREFIVYCWRGGMRSSSLFLVMDLIGYRVALIEGGYRSYRRMVNATFYGDGGGGREGHEDGDDGQDGRAAMGPARPAATLQHLQFITMHGPSGSGKSELLRWLQQNGVAVLDLERHANHKGSLLGGEFHTQPSQKGFESAIWKDLREQGLLESSASQSEQPSSSSQQPRRLFVEGESRKIGRLTVPDLFYKKMCDAEKIWVELPIEERARRLAQEYDESDDVLMDRLGRLKAFIPPEPLAAILEAVEGGRRQQAASLLLSEHYDRYYRRVAPEKVGGYAGIFREPTLDRLKQALLDYARV